MKSGRKHPITAPENPGIRFYIGLIVFLASFFMLPTGLIIKGLVVSHFWKAVIVTCFWLSAPLMKFSSIAILGKDSYLWIKYQFHHVYRKITRSQEVSRTRYNIGLVMFVFPFIPNYIISFTPHLVPTSMTTHYVVVITADLIFLLSLFVLGGDFWDKLRALFVYSSRAQFPEEEKED